MIGFGFDLHIIALVFFIFLIVYDVQTIEGLEGGCSNDPKTIGNDIEDINKKLIQLKDIKSRVDNVDTQTKQNTESLKKVSDELIKASSESLGKFNSDTEVSGFN